MLIPTIIADLFKKELSGTGWKKYSTQMIVDIIKERYHLMKHTKGDTELLMFLKKIPASLPIRDALSILADEMMGKVKS